MRHLLCLLLSVPVLSAQCVTVEGTRLLGKHLAGAHAALQALPLDADFGYAPTVGMRRVLSEVELQRIASTHSLRWPGGTLCVERQGGSLTRERVLAALREYPELSEAEISIVSMSTQPVPDGQVVFPRTGLLYRPLQTPSMAVLWRGEVRDGTQAPLPVWVRVKLSVKQTVAVTASVLTAGQPIAESQIRLEERDVFPFGTGFASRYEQLAGGVPKRSIAAGELLSLSEVKPADVVQRGQVVSVKVSSGAATLSLPGVAEGNGAEGSTVYVRNPETGKRFAARIVSAGQVAVFAR